MIGKRGKVEKEKINKGYQQRARRQRRTGRKTMVGSGRRAEEKKGNQRRARREGRQ